MSSKKFILKLFICSTIFITFVFALHDEQVVAATLLMSLKIGQSGCNLYLIISH